ncbi:MAG: prepilin-type N-terminal cleavage/methylation domain-containing protein [Thermoleophilia bacterium]
MITRIKNRMQTGGEGGFTLIELLVVIIIIAILAAIAIPMYLSQRQKGWEANVKSDLKNASVAAESYYTGTNPATYAGLTPTTLKTNGFIASTAVATTVPTATATTYCIQADHNALDNNWHISNISTDLGNGVPATGNC